MWGDNKCGQFLYHTRAIVGFSTIIMYNGYKMIHSARVIDTNSVKVWGKNFTWFVESLEHDTS